MTTSSKTNINEDLRKEFHKLWSTSEDAHFEVEEDKVWSWIETAIAKAREEGYRDEFYQALKTDRDIHLAIQTKNK